MGIFNLSLSFRIAIITTVHAHGKHYEMKLISVI
jgi:hypothetical protein